MLCLCCPLNSSQIAPLKDAVPASICLNMMLDLHHTAENWYKFGVIKVLALKCKNVYVIRSLLAIHIIEFRIKNSRYSQIFLSNSLTTFLPLYSPIFCLGRGESYEINQERYYSQRNSWSSQIFKVQLLALSII